MKHTINFKYNRKKIIFENLEIEIPENKITVICGHNGAGKTTLLKILSGIFPSKNDENLKKVKGWLVPASGGLIRHFSLKEHLDIIKAENNTNWQEAFSLFQAETFEKTPVRKLSTGQEMMASIIVACASNSEFIYLDEPFASLDPNNAENLVKILKNLRKTIIITSHDLYLTTEVADKILFIKDGKISWQSENQLDVEELKTAYKDFA